MDEKAAEFLGETNGALNTKMVTRATGMTDDEAINRSFPKLVQGRCTELNTRMVPLSVNDSSAK